MQFSSGSFRVIEFKDAVSYAHRRAGAGGDSGIYGLVDPRSPDRVRYVGSSNHIAHRLYCHAAVESATGCRTTPKHQWLVSLRRDGVRPSALVLELLDVGPRQSDVRMAREAWWVRRCGADLNVSLTPIGHANSLDSYGKRRGEENRALRARVAELEREVEQLKADFASLLVSPGGAA